MEKIEVGYTKLGSGYYHRHYYTDSNGNQYAARGGPSASVGSGGSSAGQSGS